METQIELKAQIQTLEQREKDGAKLLKEADCMWSCMEEEYKNKIALSIERQKELLKQVKLFSFNIFFIIIIYRVYHLCFGSNRDLKKHPMLSYFMNSRSISSNKVANYQ